jgi:hypothetical protein
MTSNFPYSLRRPFELKFVIYILPFLLVGPAAEANPVSPPDWLMDPPSGIKKCLNWCLILVALCA